MELGGTSQQRNDTQCIAGWDRWEAERETVHRDHFQEDSNSIQTPRLGVCVCVYVRNLSIRKDKMQPVTGERGVGGIYSRACSIFLPALSRPCLFSSCVARRFAEGGMGVLRTVLLRLALLSLNPRSATPRPFTSSVPSPEPGRKWRRPFPFRSLGDRILHSSPPREMAST